jgi:hypothetical protein
MTTKATEHGPRMVLLQSVTSPIARSCAGVVAALLRSLLAIELGHGTCGVIIRWCWCQLIQHTAHSWHAEAVIGEGVCLLARFASTVVEAAVVVGRVAVDSITTPAAVLRAHASTCVLRLHLHLHLR